jgi:hypothetical protein
LAIPRHRFPRGRVAAQHQSDQTVIYSCCFTLKAIWQSPVVLKAPLRARQRPPAIGSYQPRRRRQPTRMGTMMGSKGDGSQGGHIHPAAAEDLVFLSVYQPPEAAAALLPRGVHPRRTHRHYE